MAEWTDLIGKPFKYHGKGPDAYDCYGLLQELYRRDGVKLPNVESVADQALQANLFAHGVQSWQECEKFPGAAVLIRIGRYVSHVGYVSGTTHVIHTTKATGGVVREPLENLKHRIVGFYRYVG